MIIPGREPILRGKVRDVYDLGDRLLIIATDRVSAFDVILPQPVPEKGAILTQIARFWFDRLAASDCGAAIPHHVLSTSLNDLPSPFAEALAPEPLRFMIVEKLQMLPVECVVRGYPGRR